MLHVLASHAKGAILLLLIVTLLDVTTNMLLLFKVASINWLDKSLNGEMASCFFFVLPSSLCITNIVKFPSFYSSFISFIPVVSTNEL